MTHIRAAGIIRIRRSCFFSRYVLFEFWIQTRSKSQMICGDPQLKQNITEIETRTVNADNTGCPDMCHSVVKEIVP